MIEDGIEVMDGQEAFNEVIDLVLGNDYYIVDPFPNRQANPIILKDIKSKYNELVTNFRISLYIIAILVVLSVSLWIYILHLGGYV